MSVPGAFARVAYSLPPFWLGWKGNCGKTEIETYTEKVGYVLFIASNLLKTMVCQKFRKTYNITFKFSKIGGEWCYENTDSGSEIAPSWSPMRLKIQYWRPEFHSWSPTGDL